MNWMQISVCEYVQIVQSEQLSVSLFQLLEGDSLDILLSGQPFPP